MSIAAAGFFVLGGGRLMLSAIERQFIFFPTRVARDLPTPALPAARIVEEVWLDSGGDAPVHGLYVGGRTAVADLLFFHGNAGNLYDRLDNVEMLVQSGFNVLIIDYAGYGKSGGEPSERRIFADGEAAYRYLLDERGAAPDRLVIFGRSLGAAVAIDVASRNRCGAVIAESAFTSAVALGRLHYAWLPGFLLRGMTQRFDSLSKVGRLRSPVLFVHGQADGIVPVEMGRRLYEASPEPKRWYEIVAAGHNDTVMVGGREYFRRLVEFVREYVAVES
ncbi:MAG: alpha/beta hydrolase [Gemmatimonadales bacterium]